MKALARSLVFSLLASGCGGGSCGGRKPEPPEAKKKKPKADEEGPELVAARDYLFPATSGAKALKFEDGRSSSLRYDVSKDGGKLTVKRSGGGLVDATFIATEGGIAARISNRAVEISDRIGVGDPVDDKYVTNLGMTIETPAGTFSPCIRTMSKADSHAISRSVDYYCKGKGLVMIEKIDGTKVERAQIAP